MERLRRLTVREEPETPKEWRGELQSAIEASQRPNTPEAEPGTDSMESFLDALDVQFPEGGAVPPLVRYLKSVPSERLRSALHYTEGAPGELSIDSRGQLVLTTGGEERLLMRYANGPQVVGFFDGSAQ